MVYGIDSNVVKRIVILLFFLCAINNVKGMQISVKDPILASIVVYSSFKIYQQCKNLHKRYNEIASFVNEDGVNNKQQNDNDDEDFKDKIKTSVIEPLKKKVTTGGKITPASVFNKLNKQKNTIGSINIPDDIKKLIDEKYQTDETLTSFLLESALFGFSEPLINLTSDVLFKSTINKFIANEVYAFYCSDNKSNDLVGFLLGGFFVVSTGMLLFPYYLNRLFRHIVRETPQFLLNQAGVTMQISKNLEGGLLGYALFKMKKN